MWTTFSNGYLGSRNDEERSEMRYVVRIAKLSESSNLWTQIALLGIPRSMLLWESILNLKYVLWMHLKCCCYSNLWRFRPSFYGVFVLCLDNGFHIVISMMCYFRLFPSHSVLSWGTLSSIASKKLRILYWILFFLWFWRMEYFDCCMTWRIFPGQNLFWLEKKFLIMISNEVRRPAEFKHITKRRKRN
jgi:hypothetical protein